MFLFTSIGRRDEGPADVGSALANASRRTGAKFDYLLNTARRESNLDPSAKAGTSSATGLFQFIDSTWLAMVKETGARHGYGDMAQKIQRTGSGDYRVQDRAALQEILDLRGDPKAAALMAGEFTVRNAETLSDGLGRRPSEGELYVAHFLGAQGATDLIRLAESQPNRSAAQVFPQAAAANRSIFYGPGGAPRTVAAVYDRLVSGYAGAGGNGAGSDGGREGPAAVEPRYLAFQPGRASEDYVFHGLFRSETGSSSPSGSGGGLGPIGRAVSAFWSGLGAPKDEEPTSLGFTGDPVVETAEGAKRPGEVALDVTTGELQVADGTPSRSAGGSGSGAFREDPSLPVY